VFSWDAHKALNNLKKHDVSFEEAATIFVDPDALDWDDPEHSYSEQRSKRLVADGQNSHRDVHAAEVKTWPGTHSHHQRTPGDAQRTPSLHRIASSTYRTSPNRQALSSVAPAELAAPLPATPNISSRSASLQSFSANSAAWPPSNPNPTKP
jgi:uncharacterized DUF497 family protein